MISLSSSRVFQDEIKEKWESPARLLVKRFAKCPRLSFNKVKVGRSGTLDLLIENPNDFLVSLTTDQFSVETSLEIVISHDVFLNNDKTVTIVIPEKSFKVLKFKWSPKKAEKVRHTLFFRWDEGPKLQVILLGTAEDTGSTRTNNSKISKVLCNTRNSLEEKKSSFTPPKVEKLLTNMQLETSARRTTFTVDSTSPIKKVVKRINAGSLSPLSFDKYDSVQKENKDPLKIGKVKKLPLNNLSHRKIEDKKREDFIDWKQESKSNKPSSAKINLFLEKSNCIENISSNPKHSNYLKRQSVSRTLPVKSVQGLSVRKLKLTASSKADLPRHPLPYAAKNMCYDERWIDKQERGFTNWLNFILTPDCNDNEEDENERRGTYTIDSSKRQPIAPSREDVSFQVYSLRHKMVCLRRAGCLLYQNEEFSLIIQKIEREIECNMLAIRADKRIEADLGIKTKIRDMILSYNSLWLRIGLEVIYGEIILLQSNNDVFNLSKFVMNRVLANPLISKQYSHTTVPNFYRPGYEEAIRKFILKKFLLLVIFLDRAKQNRLIEHDPCLFLKNSEFKTSRDLLLAFSREYLKGEGDITKHLSYMGIVVQHQQSVIDEYDFGLKNIAVDLRDGVRLVRVLELLTKDWSHSSKLRLPAVSRLQKIHNNSIALGILKNHGLNLSIEPKNVVDGHREKTLMLLWQIIFHFEVNMLLDIEKLKEEIEYQKKNLQVNKELASLTQSLPESHSELISTYEKSEKMTLLLNWCQIICSHYEVKVENFTVSFSDGIALCCLVNYYHPDILPTSLINHETTLTRNIALCEEEVAGDFFYENWTKCFSPNTGINRNLEMLLMNEKHNYRVLNQAVQDLGGIPSMLRSSDMSNTIPDEKVVVTYVSYLCARLLNIREETQAARKIQLSWRRYSLRKQRNLHKVYENAALKIQNWYRKHYNKRRGAQHTYAAKVIQKTWRSYKESCLCNLKYQAERENNAAVVIQSNVRCYLTRLDYLFLRGCIILCQSVARRWFVKQDLIKKRIAASIIQSCFRGYLRTCYLRYQFLQQRASSIVIQRAFRIHISRKLSKYFELCNRAASIIQSHYKGFVCKKQYKCLKSSTIIVQQLARGLIQRKKFLRQKQAVRIIESFYISCIKRRFARREYFTIRKSILIIQQHWRQTLHSRVLRYKYLQMKSASILIQSWIKMTLARRKFLNIKQSVVIIENAWLSFQQGRYERRKFLSLKHSVYIIECKYKAILLMRHEKAKLKNIIHSVVLIQSCFRCWSIQKSFINRKNACILLQEVWRAYCAKKLAHREYCRKKHSVILLQKQVRMFLAMKEFSLKKKAVLTIQSLFRMFLCRKKYLLCLSAVVCIQRNTRHYLVYLRYKRRKAAIKIQATLKMFICLKKFTKKKHAIQVMQRFIRVFMCRRAYQHKIASIIKIQSFIRMCISKMLFKKQKNAIIKIQALARRYICQQLFFEHRNAAITIQSFFRMLLIKKIFLLKIKSAIQIQSCYRLYNARKNYNILKNSVLKIQSFFRMFICKTRFNVQKKHCIVLQSYFRMFLQRKRYLLLQCTVVEVQSKCRMKRQRDSYLKLRQSSIMIQSFFRGYRERHYYALSKKNIIKTQSYIKMFVARQKYIRQRVAIILIQSGYRMSVVRKDFIRKKLSSVKIQTVYRKHIIYKKQKKAAILIQKIFRGTMHRKKFLQQKQAAVVLQTCFRGLIQKKKFLRQKQAAVVLQAYFRGLIQKKKFLQQRIAAIQLQSFVRMFLQKKLFNQQVTAINKIKAWLRGYCLRQHFKRLTNACTLLQSTYRMHLKRKHFKLLKKSAIIIQSTFRSHYCYSKYVCFKSAVVKIQTNYRMHCCIVKYKSLRVAVIKIQAFARMLIFRSNYKKLQKAVKKLQSWWRMCCLQIVLKRQTSSAIKIQSIYRMFVIKKTYINKRNAAIKIQAFVRMFTTQSKYKKLQLQLKSAKTIQFYYRSWKVRIVKRELILENCVTIQRWWRKKRETLHQHYAAVIMQSCFRMYLLRQEYLRKLRAVSVIKGWYHMHRQRSIYLKLIESAIKLQSWYRSVLARNRFLKMKHAAITIQLYYRAFAVGYPIYLYYHLCRGAIITIQAVYRGHIARKQFQRKKKSIVILQSFFLMVAQRRKYLNFLSTVKFCQNKIRSVLIRKRYLKIKSSILTIQSFVRQHIAHRKFYAALKIQCAFKSFLAVQHLKKLKHLNKKNKAVIYLQRTYRKNALCRIERKNYLRIRNSTIVLQSHIRKWLAFKHYSKLHKSVCLIQKVWKSYNHTKKFSICCEEVLNIVQICYNYCQVRTNASLKITSFMKMIVMQKKYCKIKNSVLCIQKTWRKFAIKKKTNAVRRIEAWYIRSKTIKKIKEYQKVDNAALVIQKSYRNYCVSKNEKQKYLRLKSSVILLQCVFRKKLASKKLLIMKQAANKIENWYSLCKQKHQKKRQLILLNFIQASLLCLSLLKIQRWMRKKLNNKFEKEHSKKELSALIIQSRWRGYRIRSRINDSRLKEVAVRINIATNNSTEAMKLCNRTKSALDYILHVKNLSTVHEALKNLAVVTALSFRCCDQLMRDKALSVIYRVVNYSNRSLPWISIKEVALDILLNLAKCPTTYKGVYDHPSSTTIILDQMSNYRDKKCLIFSKACNLLTILCHDDDIKLDIKNTKKISQKVLSFYSLLNRKKQLDAHRQVQKEKKKDLFNGNAKWHRRTSAINTEDPFTAIHLLINALEIAVNV